jgi:cation:H+ antiporter
MAVFETLFNDWGGGWWLSALFIIVGFAALIYSADLFVENASKVAKIAHIPELIIGLTIVAMGTSMPELAVSAAAAIKNSAGLAIGNVTGSNILNILLVLGIAAVIKPLVFKKASIKYEMPFLILITVLMVLYAQLTGRIDKTAGILFISLFCVYLTYLVLSAVFDKSQRNFVPAANDPETIKHKKVGVIEILICLVFVAFGIMGVIIGSEIAVVGSKGIAEIIGIPDRVIGVTVVALGTSLPELVTSTIAVKHGKVDIAIGNIVGSNIFNILLILGITALISPTALAWNGTGYLIDGIVAITAAVMLFGFAFSQKKLTKTAGIIFIAAYTAYAVMTIMN